MALFLMDPLQIAIINHSILHQKQTPSIHIYPCEIDTDPITYPIDAHWRRTSIPVISHTPHGQITPQAPRLVTHAYTPYTTRTQQIKYKNILSVISRDRYHLTIKLLASMSWWLLIDVTLNTKAH